MSNKLEEFENIINGFENLYQLSKFTLKYRICQYIGLTQIFAWNIWGVGMHTSQQKKNQNYNLTFT